MKLIISNRSSTPIYEQIKAQIKDAILNGELLELKISVITTTRAYTDLENEGFVVNIQGKGCFVLPRNLELVRENALREIEESFEKVLDLAKRHSMTYNDLLEIFNNLSKEYENEERN